MNETVRKAAFTVMFDTHTTLSTSLADAVSAVAGVNSTIDNAMSTADLNLTVLQTSLTGALPNLIGKFQTIKTFGCAGSIMMC